MKDEYAAYKVHQIANFLSMTDGRGILDDYISMKKKVAKYLSLIDSLEEALNHLRIKWLDWNEFVEKRRKFEWTRNEKTNKTQFRFKDKTTGAVYDGNLKNIHRNLVNHARIVYDYENIVDLTQEVLLIVWRQIYPTSTLRSAKLQWRME
jgi:hypothetical protein